MEQNPFTPPTEVADQANVAARAASRGPFKLYLPFHVALGSFAAGVAVMAGLVTLASTVLEDMPPGVLPIGYTIIMRQVAASLQGKELVT